MNRIVGVLFFLAIAFALTVRNSSAGPSDTAELRGIYLELTSNDNFGAYPLVKDGDWRKLFRNLKQLGLNAVFPNVVSPSGAAYPSQVVRSKAETGIGNDGPQRPAGRAGLRGA